MERRKTQIALGLVSAMVIWLLLDQFAPGGSVTLDVALVRMSLLASISFGLGAVIAKNGFLVPAIVLALAIWLAGTANSLSIAVDLGNPLWTQFVWNLPNLVLVPAVAVGAIVGTRIAAKYRGT